MNDTTRTSLLATAKVALAIVALAGATGIAFAAWIDNEAGIFRGMIEAGLAWCL